MVEVGSLSEQEKWESRFNEIVWARESQRHPLWWPGLIVNIAEIKDTEGLTVRASLYYKTRYLVYYFDSNDYGFILNDNDHILPFEMEVTELLVGVGKANLKDFTRISEESFTAAVVMATAELEVGKVFRAQWLKKRRCIAMNDPSISPVQCYQATSPTSTSSKADSAIDVLSVEPAKKLIKKTLIFEAQLAGDPSSISQGNKIWSSDEVCLRLCT